MVVVLSLRAYPIDLVRSGMLAAVGQVRSAANTPECTQPTAANRPERTQSMENGYLSALSSGKSGRAIRLVRGSQLRVYA